MEIYVKGGRLFWHNELPKAYALIIIECMRDTGRQWTAGRSSWRLEGQTFGPSHLPQGWCHGCFSSCAPLLCTAMFWRMMGWSFL